MQFVIDNWYLFAALVVILYLLLAGPIRQRLYGVHTVTPNNAVRLVNHESGVIVDVREPSEFQSGHIPKSLNIPLSQLPARAAELSKFRDKPVILACQTGNRSARASLILGKNGFQSVHNLAGGVAAWRNDNLPLES